MKNLTLAVLMTVTSLASQTGQAANRCEPIFSSEPIIASKPSMDPLLHVDLLQYQQNEIRGLDRAQIAELNEQSLRELDRMPLYGMSQTRVKTVSKTTVGLVIKSMEKNPIIANAMAGLYDQPDVSIGYCFGRALYAHMALLKMGVDKDSIRKVWAVGPMRGTDGVNWQFHVATVVRGDDGKWYAVDNLLEGRIASVEEWFATFARENKDGSLRLYSTDARKFSAAPTEEIHDNAKRINGRYVKVDLGLKLDKEDDWYRGFFTDVMNWFRHGDLKSVGLEKLN